MLGSIVTVGSPTGSQLGPQHLPWLVAGGVEAEPPSLLGSLLGNGLKRLCITLNVLSVRSGKPRPERSEPLPRVTWLTGPSSGHSTSLPFLCLSLSLCLSACLCPCVYPCPCIYKPCLQEGLCLERAVGADMWMSWSPNTAPGASPQHMGQICRALVQMVMEPCGDLSWAPGPLGWVVG